MHKPLRLSDVIWGVLTIAIAGVMLKAGVREVFAYWAIEILPVAIGALGAFASSVLLVSGCALAIRMAFGRRIAMAGALSMIAVHLVGWVLGIVGAGGALPGIGYPLLLLVVLRAKPNLGAPAIVNGSLERRKSTPPSEDLHRKAGLHAALLRQLNLKGEESLFAKQE
jgi:hypothetical protein